MRWRLCVIALALAHVACGDEGSDPRRAVIGTSAEVWPTPALGIPVAPHRADVLVVGGGLGGVAAALAAADRGLDVVLTDSNRWLGGQLSSQGLGALDGIGRSRLFDELSGRIRARFSAAPFRPAPTASDDPLAALNPGDCWVSELCFDPKTGAEVIDAMLLERAEHLRVFREVMPVAVDRHGDRVVAVVLRDRHGQKLRIAAEIVIDATELGDLLPLAGADYRTGAESKDETGEPHAPTNAIPECTQPMSHVFLLEARPEGEDHTIPRPDGYDASRYDLELGDARFGVFAPPVDRTTGGPTAYGDHTFWTYRRALSAARFSEGVPFDVSTIAWGPHGNELDRACVELPDQPLGAGCNPIDEDEATRAAIFARSRALALGFVYWLQHDVPRDDGAGTGYPNLALRPDLVGTPDGIAAHPYIRESRRVRALTTIREPDLSANLLRSQDAERVRGTMYGDAVGSGWYPMDVHPCAAAPELALSPDDARTFVAELPLGALIPERIDQLLVAAKNVGTTHLTNGAFRLHPVELAIGVAAGETAALAVRRHVTPRAIREDVRLLRALQWSLIEAGQSITWWLDLELSNPIRPYAELATVAGAFVRHAPRSLVFLPEEKMTRAEVACGVAHAVGIDPTNACTILDDHGPASAFDASRGDLAQALVGAACAGRAGCVHSPDVASFADLPTKTPIDEAAETLRAWGVLDDDPVIADEAKLGTPMFRPDLPADHATVARWVARWIRWANGI